MVTPSSTTADGVTQTLHHTTSHEKTNLLVALLGSERGTVLVFARTKSRVDRLGRTIEQAGHRVAVIHGDRSLPQRLRALDGFKRGQVRILVATDIAARGIDVANIGHVVNYDLPSCPEDYIHRIGRTARMKMTGRATSFVTAEERDQLRAIETLLGHPVPLAAGSPRPGDRAHSRPSDRSRGDRQRWGSPSDDRRQHQPSLVVPEVG
jgi:ATP-dependent RNA helicase RhlE